MFQQVCRPVSAVAMSESDSTSQADAPLEIEINNDVGNDYTLIKVRRVLGLRCKRFCIAVWVVCKWWFVYCARVGLPCRSWCLWW